MADERCACGGRAIASSEGTAVCLACFEKALRRPKYGNRRRKQDGFTFDSKKEADRYEQLRSLERAGKVKELIVHPRLGVKVNGQLVCTYVGDFRYVDCETGQVVIEDVKGYRTDLYKLKKKLVKAVLGVEIKET